MAERGPAVYPAWSEVIMIQATKNQLSALVAAGLSRECFEHSIHGHFDVTRMREGLQTGVIPSDVVSLPISLLLPHVRESRVTEESRWRALPLKSWMDDPGIIVLEPDTSGPGRPDWTVMIDGHHRLLRRHFECKDYMSFHMVRVEYAIRPDPRFVQVFDWGDPMIDGKIIRSA